MERKPNTEEDFWRNVRKTASCWIWEGSRNENGYGMFSLNECQTTHRISWTLKFGKIPKGKWILHKCDNPPCVNPDHLFIGTHTDNMKDMSKKGRTGGLKKRGFAIGKPSIGGNQEMDKLSDREIKTVMSRVDDGENWKDVILDFSAKPDGRNYIRYKSRSEAIREFRSRNIGIILERKLTMIIGQMVSWKND